MSAPLLKNYQEVLIPACLLWMAGLLTALSWVPHPMVWSIWVGLFVIAICAVLTFSTQYRQVIRWYVWLLCFCLGGLLGALQPTELPATDISHLGEPSQITLRGELTGEGSSPGKWVFQVFQADYQPMTGQVMVTLPRQSLPPKPLQVGDTLEVTGRLHQPFAPVYPGQFDYGAYLKTQGITALVKAKTAEIKNTQPRNWQLSLLRWASEIRNRVIIHFKAHLPPVEAQILGSIVLGEHAVGIDPDVKNAFRQAGLIHLLAASGLNVGLIGAFFLGAGRLLKLPLCVSLLIAMLGVGAYCLLTGLPPSVQRAGTMLEIALLLKLFRRELSSISLLCIAGVVLTWIHPQVMQMLGFQLSFLSTFGLITMVTPLQKPLGDYIGDSLAGLILVPLVAQLWVTPLLLYHFSQIQLLAVPANILAVPWVAVLTYMGFILGGVSLIAPQVSGWFLNAFGFVVTGLRELAEWIGNLPLAVWPVASPPLPLILLILGALLLSSLALLSPQKPSWKSVGWVAVALLLAVLIPLNVEKWQDSQQWQTTWLPTDFGQNGIEIVKNPQGQILVAAPQLSYWGSRDLLDYLRHEGIRRIDVLLLVEPRMKSLAGLKYLMTNTSVSQVMSAPLSNPTLNRELLDLGAANHSQIIPMTGDDQIRGGFTGSLIHLPGAEDVLLRWETPSGCLVSHWGPSPLSQSSLNPLAKNCVWVQDKTPHHLRSVKLDSLPRLPALETHFSQLKITPKHVKLTYLP